MGIPKKSVLTHAPPQKLFPKDWCHPTNGHYKAGDTIKQINEKTFLVLLISCLHQL